MEGSRDSTPAFGEVVDGILTEFKPHGGGVVNINGVEYILQDDTDASIGDKISVRVLHGYEAITPGQLDGIETQKNGYPNEYYVQVYAHTSGNNRRVIGIENNIRGEDYFTGPITSPRGTHIPAIPVPAKGGPSPVVVCTDPSFWSDDYADQMGNITRLSVTQLEELHEIFIAGDPIPTKGFDIGVTGHDIVVEGEIRRFSQNDNAIVAVRSKEYTVKGVTDKSVGDMITIMPADPTSIEIVGRHPEMEGEDSNYADTPSDTPPNPEPNLTDATATYRETEKRERDPAFTENVRTAYDERCAVCGTRRVTPSSDPNPEVEAAHIYPKSEGGVDDVKNGLALCKLHHWAFDTGWLSITDDYEIIVANAPESDGYEQFVDLAGEQLRLPDDKTNRPHPKFLREHRSLHGFNHN